MANRSRNSVAAPPDRGGPNVLEQAQPLADIAVAQGRLDHGPPIAVIDIGSNSVRLVVYEGLTRSPTPIFNEKVLAGLGREVQIDRPARARCDREGARRAHALPRAVRHHAGRAAAGCSPPPPAAMPSNGRDFIAAAERICRAKIDVLSGKREAQLSALGVVSGIHQPGRHRRRSRRRLARTDRRARQPHRDRRDAAARRPGAAGHVGEVAQEGGEDRRGRRSAALPQLQGRQGARPSTPSAAPGARWRACTCGRPAIRCMSCTATRSARGRRWNSARLVQRVDPETLSQIEVGHRRPPAAARLCRAGARTHRAQRQAQARS